MRPPPGASGEGSYVPGIPEDSCGLPTLAPAGLSVALFRQLRRAPESALIDPLVQDPSVSVRKRSIKLFQSVISRRPDFHHATDVCRRILLRIVDPEESVQKVVVDALVSMWFTGLDSEKQDESSQTNAQNRALCIARVLGSPMDANKERPTIVSRFEDFVKKILEDGEKENSALRAACQAVTDELVAYVMVLEKKGTGADSILAVMSVLQSLCKAEPTLLLPHFGDSSALLPYLQTAVPADDPRGRARAHYTILYVIQMVSDVIPLLKRPKDSMVFDLETLLVQHIVVPGPKPILAAAVACLSKSASCLLPSLPRGERLQLARDTLERHYSYLQKVETGENADPQSKRDPLISRALVIIGLFCRHFDFDFELASGATSNDIVRELREDSIADVMFQALMQFACAGGEHSEAVRLSAFEGIGLFALGHPLFSVREEVRDLYDAVFDGDNTPLKRQVLRNVLDLLQHEQARSEAYREGFKESGLSLAQFGGNDTGVGSTLAGLLQVRIQECAVSSDAKLRDAGIRLLNTILIQGLINPSTVVPELIALVTDDHPGIRHQAREVLRRLKERHFDSLLQTAVEGIVKSQEFRAATAKQACGYDTQADGTKTPFLGYLYKLLRDKKQPRRRLLRNIMSLFRLPDVNANLEAYVAEHLMTFPYKVVDEPLYIIAEINEMSSVTGAAVRDDFVQILGYSDITSLAEDEDDFAAVEARMPDPVPEEFCGACNRAEVRSCMAAGGFRTGRFGDPRVSPALLHVSLRLRPPWPPLSWARV